MQDMKTLILKAKAGDADAFAELYELTKDRAYFIGARYVNADDVADVLQESYITVMRNLPNFDENEPIEPWLHTIIRSRAIDFIRRKKPISSLDADEFPEIEDLEAVLPDEYLEREDVRRTILRIIDNLPDNQRLTVVMRYFEGKTNEEIAELIDCSINTVGSRLRYAKKAIREAVLLEEKKGNKLYGIMPLPFLTKLFKMEMESGSHHIPEAISEQVASAIAESLTTAGSIIAGASAATEAGSATAGGVTASSTVTSIGFIGKLTSLSVSAKAVIAAVCAVAVVAGAGVPLYLHSENQKAALILQQEQEEQSRLEAEEQARIEAEEAAEKARFAEEAAAAEQVRQEAVEAARIEAEEASEQARIEAGEAAAEAARLEAEAVSEQASSVAEVVPVEQASSQESSEQARENPPESSAPPASSAPSAPANATTLNGAFGSVSISQVTSTSQQTINFIGESQTITVYRVPATCRITFNDSGAELTTYKRQSEGVYSWVGYVNTSAPVSLSSGYDLYVITQDSGAGLVYYGIVVG